jgi:hypothetical protein
MQRRVRYLPMATSSLILCYRSGNAAVRVGIAEGASFV